METLKLTNEVLNEALALEDAIRRAQKRLDEIKAAAKARGSFATREFVVAVTEASRQQLAGLSTVEQCLGRDTLEQFNLINTVKYQVVKIARKEGA